MIGEYLCTISMKWRLYINYMTHPVQFLFPFLHLVWIWSHFPLFIVTSVTFQLKLSLKISLLNFDNLITDKFCLIFVLVKNVIYILLSNIQWLSLVHTLNLNPFACISSFSRRWTKPTNPLLFYSSQDIHSIRSLSFLPHPLNYSLLHTILYSLCNN